MYKARHDGNVGASLWENLRTGGWGKVDPWKPGGQVPRRFTMTYSGLMSIHVADGGPTSLYGRDLATTRSNGWRTAGSSIACCSRTGRNWSFASRTCVSSMWTCKHRRPSLGLNPRIFTPSVEDGLVGCPGRPPMRPVRGAVGTCPPEVQWRCPARRIGREGFFMSAWLRGLPSGVDPHCTSVSRFGYRLPDFAQPVSEVA